MTGRIIRIVRKYLVSTVQERQRESTFGLIAEKSERQRWSASKHLREGNSFRAGG